MADVWATKNGVWSDVTVWNTGALPTTADDVYADGRLVYIDINTRVLSISNGLRSGGTVNGYFIGNNGVSLSADVLCRDGSGGSVIACLELLSAAPSTFTVFGNVVGATASNGRAIRCTSSGTLTVFGNVSGGTGSGNAWGIDNQSTGIVNVIGDVRPINVLNAGAILNGSTGTVNVTGNVFGSSTGANNRGINNSGAGSVNVLGNIFGGTGTGNVGIINSSSGTVFVIGSLFGQANGAFINASTGTSNILGNVTGGTAANGLSNSTTGTVNITGNVFGGSGSNTRGVYNQSTGTVTIYGDVSGNDVGTSGNGFQTDGNGQMTLYGNVYGKAAIGAYFANGTNRIFGNVYGGSGSNAYGLRVDSGSTILSGSAFAGPGSSTHGGFLNGAGTLVVTGSAYASAANSANGVLNNSTGTIIVSGSVVGHGRGGNNAGAWNTSTGTITIGGAAIGGNFGSTGSGAVNNSTGILRVKRAIGNDWGLGYTEAVAEGYGVWSVVQGSQTFVEELQCGSRGQWPTRGVIYFTPNTKATAIFETDTFQNYSLIQSNSADNLVPPVSSVRQGEVYDLGLDIGTCIIPPVSSVAWDTLVDNLTGTAVLTPQDTWNYPITASDVDSMGGRLRNALNTNAANTLINSFNP